ncbi:MAG: LrgB family protein [Lachnospiraceae bacterium]|nr:LrgB family protein [Lachnospiraceae bacterium]
MNEFFASSVYAGTVLTLLFFYVGMLLKKKFKSAIVNPLLIAVGLTIAFLVSTKTEYSSYYEGARYISWFLTPATICLAVPLYEQMEALKKNAAAILCGILSGVVASLLSVLILSVLFGLSHREYVTFLPKSITTAIGMAVSEEMGGYSPITVAVIIMTGITGNLICVPLLKVLCIKEPVAKGIAIGTASHAIGTAKAMEIGSLTGAMSSLSIVVSGVFTVILAPVFATFY